MVISDQKVNSEVEEQRSLRYEIIADRGVFETETRREVYEAVLDDPGGTETEYGEMIGIDRTTAGYHLGILTHFGYLRSERDNHVRYFPHGRDGD